MTTRRAGKTQGAIRKGVHVATSTPDVNVLYLSTTIKRAVSTLWDELVAFAARFGGVPNHSRHFVRFPNGSKFWVSGCETKQEANAWRGVLPRTALVFLDEGQDWRDSLLRYTYGDVIVPSLADIGGAFLMAGTPGPPRGFFYEFHRSAETSSHNWSLFQNPHVKDAQRLLDTALKVRGVTIEDPSIRREFFAEFAIDLLRRIFPDPRIVERAALPTGLRHVIGADFGNVDACAVVVLGFKREDPNVYLVEAQAKRGLGSSGQAAFVAEVSARYRGAITAQVGDPGGGGKAIVQDLIEAHDLDVEAAQKTEKVSAIRLMRDAVRSGVFLVPSDEAGFISDLAEPEWDPDYVGERVHGHMPDRIDAAIYAFRELSKHHRFRPGAPPKTAAELQAERIWARVGEQGEGW